MCLIVFFSTLSGSYTQVLLGTGSCVLISYLLGMLPKVSKYVPTALMSSAALLVGDEAGDIYVKAIVVTIIMCVTLLVISIPIMNKKQL